MRTRSHLWLFAVLAMLATACGSSESDDAAETSTPASAESPAEDSTIGSSERANATGTTEDGTAAPDEPADTAETPETAETTETAAPSGPSEPSWMSEPVTIRILMQSGGGPFDLLQNLGDEFSRQFPNVTFEYQRDSFDNLLINGPRLLASDDPPDLVLMPQIVDPAAEGLVLNLDPYFEEFGWHDWSPSQLAQNRVNDQGGRGSGPLYGVGAGYSITGVFYNKEHAAQVGMDAPPASLDELESLMAAAKDNGILPVISQSPAIFPYQAIHNQYVDPADIAGFIFLAPGATIDTPEAIAAAERFERWANEGYLNEDINSLDYASMMARFMDGEGLFMFNGSWEGANLDANMSGNVGFFLVPPLEADDPPVATGASGTVVVAAEAAHPDVAAFFLDWVHTNPAARQEISDTTGMAPGGSPTLPLPESEPGSIVGLLQEQAAFLASDGVTVDFLANATSGFFSNTLTPEVQRLAGGQTDPESFTRALQEGYEASIDR